MSPPIRACALRRTYMLVPIVTPQAVPEFITADHTLGVSFSDGAGVLQHVIPAGIYASLAVYTSYWWLLVLIPILPLSYIIGAFLHAP